MKGVVSLIMSSERGLEQLKRKFGNSVDKMKIGLKDQLKHGSMSKFVDEMTAARLITDDQKGDLDLMIGYFKASWKVIETVKDLEDHCCSFLEILEKMGSEVFDTYARKLEESWISDAKFFDISLSVIGRRHGQEVDYGRDYLHIQKSYKYSKNKQAMTAKADYMTVKDMEQLRLHADKSQLIRYPDDDDEYPYPESQEQAMNRNDSKGVSSLWAKSSENARLPLVQPNLPNRETCTEVYMHDRRTSLSYHIFISDGLECQGDPVINHAALLHYLIEQPNNRPKKTDGQSGVKADSTQPSSATSTQQLNEERNSELSPTAPRHQGTSELSDLATLTSINQQTDSHTATTTAHIAQMRGELTDQKPFPTTSNPKFSSASVSSDFYCDTNVGQEEKSRTLIVPRGSTATDMASTATSVMSNDQMMAEVMKISNRLSHLELEQTKTQTKCCHCSQMEEELQKKNVEIAELKAQLKTNEHFIEQLLNKLTVKQ